jgi:DNA-binding XRE family transcriptional regulator
MNSQEYKVQRELRGTQTEVATMLGVTRQVVSRRESGAMVTKEAWLALNALPKKRKAKNVL